MIRPLWWVVPLLFIGGCARSPSPIRSVTNPATDPDPSVFCGVENFAWTERGVVARAAQPSARELECLREAEFASVINLRHESSRFDEAEAVASLEMEYLRVPMVDDTAPSPDQVTDYLAFIKEHSPVFSHDAVGRGRMGVMDGIYLLWKGWPTNDVFERYIHFGAKIDCQNGGNGQIQALHAIGVLLERGDAWPVGPDQFDNVWEDCPVPEHMKSWDYGRVEYPHPETGE